MQGKPENVLGVGSRAEFRAWLEEHAATESECWVFAKRGRPGDADERLYYLDAVEEALCFGWIDSTNAKIDGVTMQRFSTRRKNSVWTELNKERVRRLERLGLMTDAGRAVLPPMEPRSFKVDADVERALKDARVFSKFKRFPALYQRIRAYNVAFYKNRDKEAYEKALVRLVEKTAKGEMYGEWNDYGRLLLDGLFDQNIDAREPRDTLAGVEETSVERLGTDELCSMMGNPMESRRPHVFGEDEPESSARAGRGGRGGSI